MVGLLTTEQKELIAGQEYATDSFFNPIQDFNDNWVISEEEIDQSTIDWVKELPKIKFIKKLENEFS